MCIRDRHKPYIQICKCLTGYRPPDTDRLRVLWGGLTPLASPLEPIGRFAFGDLDFEVLEGCLLYTSYYAGTLQGSEKNGKLYYRPDASMTRQEFIVAMMRYLGTDLSAYASVQLPFDDSGSIASWAKSAMQAAYQLGYLTGSKTNGKLLAKPGSTISRQEAMTILSRTKDFADADLNVLSAFSDSGKIADWARTALAQMTQQKIISGSKGKLNPTGKVTRAEVAKMLYMLSET